MSDYIDVAILAKNVCQRTALEVDDQHVPGVYSVLVPKMLNESTQASIALDAFHSKCAVDCLEDFEFHVFDPRTGKVLKDDPDHEAYSKEGVGRDLAFITDEMPGLYRVSVLTEQSQDDDNGPGVLIVVADDSQAACNAARNLLRLKLKVEQV